MLLAIKLVLGISRRLAAALRPVPPAPPAAPTVQPGDVTVVREAPPPKRGLPRTP